MKKLFGRGMVLGFVAMAAACASGEAIESGEAPAVVAQAADDSKIALRIEKAARALDRGEDASRVKAEVEAVLADAQATAAERDDATLVLSRSLEASGDLEGAITVMEKLLAAHAEDREWTASDQASRRLRKLVTGSEEESSKQRRAAPGPVSELANHLVKFFPADPAGKVRFRLLQFGGRREWSEKLGTFNVPDAIRQNRQESCANCKTDIDSRSSHDGSWLGIPRQRASLGSSLVVIYFDLEGGKIPARYDADLPLPSAEIASRLARGEGLVMAKEREGAPPVVVIAAPRFAQLDNVEEALAKMKVLPTSPTSITLAGNLEPEEIQDVVRPSFGTFRGCYEDVLKTNPTAQGRIFLDFKIEPDGHVTNAKVNVESSDLSAMHTCMLNFTQNLAFPAAPQSTTVVYPIMFSPGED